MYLSPPPPDGLDSCLFLDGGYVVVDLLFIVTHIVGGCICSMLCCTLLYVHHSFAINLMGTRELVALLSLSSWCVVIFCVALPRGVRGLSAVCDCGIS